MKKISLLFFLLFSGSCIFSQQMIKGHFPLLENQYVTLKGFHDFESYTIDSVQIDENGDFVLHYYPTDYGMGYLTTSDKKTFSVVLCGETIELKGENLAYTESIEIVKGEENRLFELYVGEHIRREQTLSAWVYLEKIYALDSLFMIQLEPKNAIKKEKSRIQQEDNKFLANLDKTSYLHWYLPLRKLISSVSTIAQYRTEEIPDAIAAFRQIDYMEPKLSHSGLLADVIDAHFWLIENSGRNLDSVYIEMNVSIDVMIENLVQNEQKFDQINKYLLKLLEKRSLYPTAEHLALKILHEKRCPIEKNFLKQLENYRTMKVGKIAPDINFNHNIYLKNEPQQKLPQKLSAINNRFVLLVFGASWCTQSSAELASIFRYYPTWKEQDLEVVFVSLDENKEILKNFSSIFPFFTYCDYKKWESPAVQNYYIYTTPTFYLLNKQREIILKPTSAYQVNAWVDWYLIQGNLKAD